MPSESTLAIRVRVDREGTDVPRLDVALDAPVGITVVMGPSGAGKSTLLAAAAGLLRPASGTITLGDEVFFDAAQKVFVPPHRRGLALVFQSLALFPHLSAWENVAYGVPKGAGATKEARRAEATRWLSRMQAAHVEGRMPATLSGGEAQRVALARAFASRPRALLLDEPFSALDADLRRALGDVLVEVVDAVRIPTLLVTHSGDDASRLGARVCVIEAGRIVGEDGGATI